MSNRLVLRPLCLVSSLAAVFFFAAEHPSAARPLYKKVFDSEYKTVLTTNKTTCTVCHSSDDKRKLNHYGKAIAEELGEKNVREFDKIVEALRAVAKQRCKSGEWQERLDRGLIPCDCGEYNADSYIARQLRHSEHP